MVVTTLATLSQTAPARRGAKTRHSDGRTTPYNQTEPYHADRGGFLADTDSAVTIRSVDSWTRSHQSQPGTSFTSPDQHDENSSQQRHALRHRQHDERHHDPARRRHKQRHHNQQQNSEPQQQQPQSPSSRGRYEHLCETVMKTVHLNTETEEYNPPFYVEVRCRQPEQTHSYSSVQVSYQSLGPGLLDPWVLATVIIFQKNIRLLRFRNAPSICCIVFKRIPR